MDSLRRLGEAVREVQDREAPSVDLRAQRARFLERSSKPRVQRSPRRVVALASGVAFVAAAAALLVFLLRAPTLSFEIAGIEGRPGEWIAAPVDRELPLAFSDGTKVVLERETSARVVDLGANGARVVVERGAVRADVVHRTDTSWQVNAGPFEVQVVGTRFDVAWDPTREAFSLTLHEGAVRVVGPMGDSGRVVRAGERLEVRVGETRSTSSLAASSASASVADAPSASTNASRSDAPSSGEPRLPDALPPGGSPSSSSPSTWRVLAQKGDNRAAWAAIEVEGADAVMGRASATELVALADVARFAGHPAQATAALSELRRRFPKDPAAADAAFLLGRTAFDQRGSPSAAAAWFATYLREKPSGSFAREAMGRLLECHRKTGSTQAARDVADRYLATYPDGPHAQLARRTLDGESSSPSSPAP